MTLPSQASAGWYPDPDHAVLERMFDGVEWTDSRRPRRAVFAARRPHPALLRLMPLAFILAVLVGIPVASGASAGVLPAVLVLVVLAGTAMVPWWIYLARGERAHAKAQRLMVALSASSIAQAPVAPPGIVSGEVVVRLEGILGDDRLSTAEQLRQLDRLRYERLLSDEEFQQAKERILGIGPSAQA